MLKQCTNWQKIKKYLHLEHLGCTWSKMTPLEQTHLVNFKSWLRAMQTAPSSEQLVWKQAKNQLEGGFPSMCRKSSNSPYFGINVKILSLNFSYSRCHLSYMSKEYLIRKLKKWFHFLFGRKSWHKSYLVPHPCWKSCFTT